MELSKKRRNIYGAVGLILGVLSIGCGFQMIGLIKDGESYTANLWFHPISAVLSIACLIIYFSPNALNFLRTRRSK